MALEYKDYLKIVDEVKKKITDFKPIIGVVLGTGLNDFASLIDVKGTIKYENIPNLKKSTNKAHAGEFIFGYLNDIPLVLMNGRIHCYEGYSSEEATRQIRLMALLGIKTLILTNAAGGINEEFNSGDFMMIEDQISTFIESPLRGQNIEEFGTRFPDMSNVYDQVLTNKIYEEAKKENLPIKKGVYLQAPGPNFESKSEIRAFKILSADACGMSTAIEAIVSNHMHVKTIGISFISNLACGLSSNEITDEEVQVEATKSKENLTKLLKLAIETAYKAIN